MQRVIHACLKPIEIELLFKEFEDTKGADRNRKSEDRQDHGQQNETKDKHRTHNTSLKTKAGVTRTIKKPG